MTILDDLRPHGPLEVSPAPLDDLDTYRRLLRTAPRTGRCPVLLADRALTALPDTDGPAPGRDAPDPGRELAARYPGGCVFHAACLAPFGRAFPGLAPPTATRALLTRAEVVEAAVEEAAGPGGDLLGVARARRPADVPAAVGWTGGWSDRAALSAVLRSWEDRFGAVLVRMGRASLELAVAAPPWEGAECLGIAAEHVAFCDDTWRGNPGTLRDLANLLRGATRWSFWWEGRAGPTPAGVG